MVKGYLLIKLVPGLESDAIPQIRATSGILDVNLVFGQWDAIAIAEGKSLFGGQSRLQAGLLVSALKAARDNLSQARFTYGKNPI